jgi:hypothetical protein
MGQQQLLLIVLGIIIVGVALVVGLHLYTAYERQSQIDSITIELQSYASMALAYYKKPKSLGGGGHSFDGFKPIINSTEYDSTKSSAGMLFHWWHSDFGLYGFSESPGYGSQYIELAGYSRIKQANFILRVTVTPTHINTLIRQLYNN